MLPPEYSGSPILDLIDQVNFTMLPRSAGCKYSLELEGPKLPIGAEVCGARQ